METPVQISRELRDRLHLLDCDLPVTSLVGDILPACFFRLWRVENVTERSRRLRSIRLVVIGTAMVVLKGWVEYFVSDHCG